MVPFVVAWALLLAPAAPVEEPRTKGAARSIAHRTFEFDVPLLAGIRLFRSLRAFDDALRESGYGPLPRSLPTLGADLGLTVGRWRFRLGGNEAWSSAASRTGSPGSVGAHLAEARLDGGYDFLRWRSLTGFVLLGVSGATFTMDAVAPHWNYLGAQGAMLGNPSSIHRDAGLFTVQAGFEHVLLHLGRALGGTLGLLVSLQAGFADQFALGPWFSDAPHATVQGTADVDFGGTWIALGVGVVAIE